MILNSNEIVSLDLESTYLKLLEKDNYEFSLVEISKLSSTRLHNLGLPPVMEKVKSLVEGLGDNLIIREDDVIRLDANMINCIEIRFAARSDIKVNLYIEDETTRYLHFREPDYDEDEMYFSYKHNNRRRILHGPMDRMIEALKLVLNET